MDFRHICFVYFSPTGTTRNVVEHLDAKWNYKSTEKIDLTCPSEDITLKFAEDDFVVFCYPVYSGRVPELMMKRLETLAGSNTPAAIVCTYGCREYDDALMEMKDFIRTRGFKAIAAMSVAVEHSVVHSIGKGRPDINDENVMDVFAKEAREKLLSAASINQFSELTVPGNHRYRKYIHVPMTPVTLDSCNKCGACVKLCPAGAITLTDSIHTDKSLCFGCVRCIKNCPNNARAIGKAKDAAAKLILEMNLKHKTSEIFL